MVDENRIKEWVKQKLDKGVEPERIKKSLKETGHDPSIVDEVQDPFSGGKTTEESGEKGSGLSSDIGASSLEGGEESHGSFEQDEESTGEDSGSGRSLPSFSLSVPDLPVWPAAVLGVLILGFAGYSLVPWGSLGVAGLPPVDVPEFDLPDSSSLGGSEEESGGSCPDVGVRIDAVYTTGGQTKADVLVTRGTAEVVLEVYDGQRLLGSSSKTIGGQGSMTVDAVGSEAILRPSGCWEYQDTEAIG